MKLRNKKTGEIFDALIREKGGGGSYSFIVCDIKAYEQSKSTLDETHFILDEYENLAELNEYWEDYKPKEPLIKDEKIRKAVRAWAEIGDIDKVYFDSGGLYWTEGFAKIEFADRDWFKEIKVDTVYAITELCGEE